MAGSAEETLEGFERRGGDRGRRGDGEGLSLLQRELYGLVMIVTPGPALVVIPVGLAILSVEFAWARHWVRTLREAISSNSLNSRARRAEEHRDRTEGS